VREPHVRNQNTIGLATWPTQIGARLAGAMEVIEREAYMIMWLNQLVLPRINLQPLCDEHPSLAKLIETCARYRMRVHAIRMLTDVPTHAVCVVLEDLSGHAPRFAVGLKANRSLVYAIEKSINEALRARRGYRNYFMQGNTWDASTPVADIGHRERLYYWGAKPEGLDVLISGAEETVPHMPWDNDTSEQHYDRIIQWCAQKGFECVSVALTRSPSNPTPFHIEMVALPDLVPTHLRENERAFGAERIRSVPEAFGYQPLDEPFTDSPHPFS
jgi:ribosomal protein S12 methylthiotransferase accessory factor